MEKTVREITLLQFILLIHGVQVGVGILTLPRELAEGAGTDGWISILIGWAIAVTASFFIIQIMRKHPGATFMDILSIYLGKWLATGVMILFASYFTLAMYTALLRTIEILRTWVLPLTPSYTIMFLLLVPTYIVIRGGMMAMARYTELTFFLLIWLPFFLLIPLKDSHWLHLLPVIKEEWQPVFQTAYRTFPSFLGFEIAFILYPYLLKKEKAVMGIVIANTLSMTVFLGVTLLCFAFFSPDNIVEFSAPTLSYLKVIELRFIERLDIVFLSFYLFMICTTWLPYLYNTLYVINHVIVRANFKVLLAIFTFILILSSLLFQPTYEQVAWLLDINGTSGLFIAFVFPFILWVVQIVERRVKS